MIVFDLRCDRHGHIFEAWFGSSDAFEQQRLEGLISCPTCGHSGISKALMSPNLGVKGNARRSLTPMAKLDGAVGEGIAALMGKIAEIQAATLPSSEWVGGDFDRRARAMEAGDEPVGSIYGEASHDEARALIEDGVGIMPLLVPVVPPSKRN